MPNFIIDWDAFVPSVDPGRLRAFAAFPAPRPAGSGKGGWACCTARGAKEGGGMKRSALWILVVTLVRPHLHLGSGQDDDEAVIDDRRKLPG